MSTIDTSTWSPDSSLNTDIGGIPLNADASIQQTWRAIQMLMAALKGDTAAIELTINQPDGTTIVATNQTLTVVDNGHAHTIANVAGLQTALNGKASNAGMTGATASADGTSGLVPKPEAGDQDKVLKGDGTWGTAPAASSVAWSDVTGKPATFTPSSHTHGSITNDGKLGTASRAVVTGGDGAVGVSSVTATELDCLSGVTSAVQTQLDAKAVDSGVVHNSGIEEVSGMKTVRGTNPETYPEFACNWNHIILFRALALRDTLEKSCFFIRRYRQNFAQGASGEQQFALVNQENKHLFCGVMFRTVYSSSESETKSTSEFVPTCFYTGEAGGKTYSFTNNLGTATYSWDNLHCSSGPWSSSDARMKSSVENPSESLLKAWEKVGFKVFQFNDAVAKKGENARLHVGLVAQDVQKAFAVEGIDAERYGLFGHDKWEDKYEEGKLVQKAGDKYSIRYEEALCLEAACQRRRADMLEKRIAALEVALKAKEE